MPPFALAEELFGKLASHYPIMGATTVRHSSIRFIVLECFGESINIQFIKELLKDRYSKIKIIKDFMSYEVEVWP